MIGEKTILNFTSEDIELFSSIGVYCITSKCNGKKYIGSTTMNKGFGKRWYEHIIRLKKNKHCNRHLQNHVNKYGLQDLSFSILEITDDINKCRLLEKTWLDKYEFDNCFNISKETDISICGKTHPLYKNINTDLLIKTYNDGINVPALAKIFNVSTAKIKKELYDSGIKNIRRTKKFNPYDLYLRHKNGETFKNIAKDVGIDRVTLRKALRQI